MEDRGAAAAPPRLRPIAANQLARRVGGQADPRAVFEEALAPIASTETRQAITRAESRPQALALLFMAPEFQRR